MIYRDKINILKPVKGKDTIGRTSVNYVVDRTIDANFQPLNYNIRRRPFGITDKTSNMIFCADFSIAADMRIEHQDNQYIINSILPYRKHVEIYVEKVI